MPRLLPAALLLVAAMAAAAERVVIEDWSHAPPGGKGIPRGWAGQSWGRPEYDFTVVEDDGRRALHLKSRNERSTITRDIRGRVDLRATPVLEWSWKAVALPGGGDARRKETTDQAAQLYVVWPRFPEAVRSRIIGYAWDTATPAGAILRSQKTGTVTYIIVRSGAADLGRWITERRNVADDYRRIYGEDAAEPGAISLSIDSNDTHSTAESFFGSILFRAP
jgi:hypothetical protein